MIHLQEGGSRKKQQQSSLLKASSKSVLYARDSQDNSPCKSFEMMFGGAKSQQGLRLRLNSCETYQPQLNKELSDCLTQLERQQQKTFVPTENDPELLAAHLEQIIANCTNEIAEKLLTLLEEAGQGPLSESQSNEIRRCLSQDQVVAKDVNDFQASYRASIIMLIAGIVSLAACLFCAFQMFEIADLNPMEVTQISSVVAWLTTTTVLLGYTREDPTSKQLGEEIYGGISQDMQQQLFVKLAMIDFQDLIDDVKILRQDDVMTYLGIKPQFRTVTFIATMLMVAGLLLLAYSVNSVSFYLCVLSVCLLTPAVSSMAFNQSILGSWSVKITPATESTHWLGDIVTFVASLVCIILLNKNSESQSGDWHNVLPMVSSVLMGSSLGLYKRISLSQTACASPRFPTAFIFFATFAMVVISPSLKFPQLADQVQQLAIKNGDEIDQESDYYSDRVVPVALCILLGFLATFTLFAIFNALQHPQIRQSHINMLLSIAPVTLCLALTPQQFAPAVSNLESTLSLSVAFTAVILTNVFKACTTTKPMTTKDENMTDQKQFI